MSPTAGPCSTPGGTGATTGPYAVEVDLPVLVDQLRAAVAAAPETGDPEAEPPIGSVVLDHGGVAWQRADDGYWKTHTGRSNGWKYMTATFGPVTALAAAATPAPPVDLAKLADALAVLAELEDHSADDWTFDERAQHIASALAWEVSSCT